MHRVPPIVVLHFNKIFVLLGSLGFPHVPELHALVFPVGDEVPRILPSINICDPANVSKKVPLRLVLQRLGVPHVPQLHRPIVRPRDKDIRVALIQKTDRVDVVVVRLDRVRYGVRL